MNPRPLRLVVALVAGLALAASACGPGEPTAEPGSAPSTTADGGVGAAGPTTSAPSGHADPLDATTTADRASTTVTAGVAPAPPDATRPVGTPASSVPQVRPTGEPTETLPAGAGGTDSEVTADGGADAREGDPHDGADDDRRQDGSTDEP